MAIIQGLCNSFKTELLGGVHDLDTDTLKVALYSSAASIGPQTTAYTTTGEVVGSGYTAGGATLAGATIAISNGVAYVDFTDVSWPSATFTARGALIYNSSKANRAIHVLSFGTDRTVANATFPITFPSANYREAIIRLA